MVEHATAAAASRRPAASRRTGSFGEQDLNRIYWERPALHACGRVEAAPVAAHGRPHSLTLTLPPLGALFLTRDAAAA